MEKNQHGCSKGKQDKLAKNIIVFIAGMLLFASPLFSLEKESVSVGVVNVVFLMENAPQSELASNNLKEKFFPQEKKLAEELEVITSLESELKKLIASKTTSDELKRKKERELRSRRRARTRSLQDFREELRFARDTALDEVQKEVFSAIDYVRKQRNIDIVIQDYISATESVDITTFVLEHLDDKLNNNPQTIDPKTEDKKPLDNNKKKDANTSNNNEAQK